MIKYFKKNNHIIFLFCIFVVQIKNLTISNSTMFKQFKIKQIRFIHKKRVAKKNIYMM